MSVTNKRCLWLTLAFSYLLTCVLPVWAIYQSSTIGGGAAMRGADVTPPAFSSATINGTALVVNWTEACTRGVSYNDTQLDLDMSTTGANIGVTYQSGDGTSQWTYTAASAAVNGETVDLDFDGTANSIEDGSGNDLPALVSSSVTNTTPPAASPMCDSGCNAVADADLFCEDMDGTPGSCTWTNAGTIDWDSTTGLGDLVCSEKGDSVLNVAMTTGTDNYTSYSFTGTTDYFDEFWIRISSTAVGTNGEYQIISYITAGGGIDMGLYISYVTDHLEWQVGVDGARTNVGADGTIALNTWYKLTRQYDGATAVRLWMDGTLIYEDTSVTENDSVAGVLFGTISAGINYNTTYQVALIKADNDTEPAVCE